MAHVIEESTSLYVIKPSYNNLELAVELQIIFLTWFDRMSYVNSRASFIHKCSSHICFIFVDICHTEKIFNLDKKMKDTYRKRNYLFKLVRSILSRSITWIFLTPERARSLRISHPRPPAPTTRTLVSSS